MPSVIELAGAVPILAPYPSRCQEGSFIEGVPAEEDAYIMKDIIHDWDDTRSAGLIADMPNYRATDRRDVFIRGQSE